MSPGEAGRVSHVSCLIENVLKIVNYFHSLVCQKADVDFSVLTMTSKLSLQRKQRRDIHWYLINLYHTEHAKFCAESKFNCLNVLCLAQAHFANRGGKSFSWLGLSLLKTSLKYWIEVKVYWELFYFHSLVCLVFSKIEPHVTTLGVCNRVRSRS